MIKTAILKRTHSYLPSAGNLYLLVGSFLLSVALSACGVYSFTGASVSADVKTFSVAYFENNAPLVNPTLSQAFTEALKERIINSTNLGIGRANGDVEFEGQIIDYSSKPIAIQGNEIAGQNRLSISIRVKYINNKDEEKNYETTLTRFADYPGDKNLNDVEAELIRQINIQLVDDIFNKSFVNW
jgi:hypothetical protein